MWYQLMFNLKYQTERLEQAMLDDCSQGSFEKKTLPEELKVDGKSTTATVKSLNGDFKHSSFAVDDLEVANIEGKQVGWITLPKMFS